MKIELAPLEARVIGCLIEKQITTPDQYPLSLNALVNACNQKSNRDPLLHLDEAAAQSVLDGLSRKHFVMEKSGFGARVPKYQHRFCNTEFGTLKLDPLELAIICELLLRGPQTPGELRTRASRMAPIAEVPEVESALHNLMSRSDGPFVTRLAREPGRRDSRYAHLFSGPVAGEVGPVVGQGGSVAAESGPVRELRASGAGNSAGPPNPAPSHYLSGSVESGAPAPEVSFPAARNEERLGRIERDLLALKADFDELKRRLGG